MNCDGNIFRTNRCQFPVTSSSILWAYCFHHTYVWWSSKYASCFPGLKMESRLLQFSLSWASHKTHSHVWRVSHQMKIGTLQCRPAQTFRSPLFLGKMSSAVLRSDDFIFTSTSANTRKTWIRLFIGSEENSCGLYGRLMLLPIQRIGIPLHLISSACSVRSRWNIKMVQTTLRLWQATIMHRDVWNIHNQHCWRPHGNAQYTCIGMVVAEYIAEWRGPSLSVMAHLNHPVMYSSFFQYPIEVHCGRESAWMGVEATIEAIKRMI